MGVRKITRISEKIWNPKLSVLELLSLSTQKIIKIQRNSKNHNTDKIVGSPYFIP